MAQAPNLMLDHLRKLVGGDECADRELLERFNGRHEDAVFAALLQRHGPLVLGVCQRVLNHTHGHIDDLARFVGPRTVVTMIAEDRADANYEALQDNLQRLRSMTDLDGRPLDVVTLPMPGPVVLDGQRLPASYANFYIANDLVLMPTFNDPRDCEALGILAGQFPDRQVVGIHAVDLVWGLGTLHCLTQQQPRGATG